MHITYAAVHTVIASRVDAIKAFKPDVILAIGGGGFIPARILRSHVNIPILAVTLKLYNDQTKGDVIQVVQWLDAANLVTLRDKRVLIVDEIDDTRTTLLACIRKLRETAAPSAIGTFVLFDKHSKTKAGAFPNDVSLHLVGQAIEDVWVVFPWELEGTP